MESSQICLLSTMLCSGDLAMLCSLGWLELHKVLYWQCAFMHVGLLALQQRGNAWDGEEWSNKYHRIWARTWQSQYLVENMTDFNSISGPCLRQYLVQDTCLVFHIFIVIGGYVCNYELCIGVQK